MRMKQILTATAAALAAMSAQSQPVVVTFEGTPTFSGGPGTSGTLSYSESGFTFATFLIIASSGGAVRRGDVNGCVAEFAGSPCSLTIKREGGGLFSLDAFDGYTESPAFCQGPNN